MPRRTRGLGPAGNSRISVKGLAGLLKNLDPGVRNQLDSAFSGVEDVLNAHVLSVPENQIKRLSSGLINQIQATIDNTLLGAFISWPRLDDPRIAFYEIQTSDDSVFSSFESFQILEQFFVLENLTSVKFVRIRGVRSDGQTGIWSDTLTANPVISTPKVNSVQFYQSYTGSSPTLSKQLKYSKGNYHGAHDFYTILSTNFYTNAILGGVTVWGYTSNRLARSTIQGVTPWDRVRFRVNGITKMEGYFPHWTSRFDERIWNINDFYPSAANTYANNIPGAEMSGSAQGGYTAAFGTFSIEIPNTIKGIGPNDPTFVNTVNPIGGAAFYWEDFNNVKIPSNFEEGQLPVYADLAPRHEAHCDNVSAGGSSNWLVFQDFKFNVPAKTQITGIKAEIKRRQYPPNDVISANFGRRRPDKADGDDFVLEYQSQNGSAANLPQPASPKFIFNDPLFGRYLNTSGGFIPGSSVPALPRNSAALISDSSGIGNDGVWQKDINLNHSNIKSSTVKLFDNNKFTISAWFRVRSDTAMDTASRYSVIEANLKGVTDEIDQATSSRGVIRILVVPNLTITKFPTSINSISFQLSETAGGNQRDKVYAPIPGSFDSRVDEWHHVAITYDKSSDSQVLIFNGTPPAVGTTGTLNSNLWDSRRRVFGVGSSITIGSVGVWQGDLAQVGIWNNILGSQEILAIKNQKGTADYRRRFGRYKSNHQLNHYFLFFPDQADVRDESVILIDSTGLLREDLNNKAITDESWPRLGQFFYTDVRQFGILPLAASDGIPHDNHLAIGYQDYGGIADTWGLNFYAEDVNSPNFGFALKIKNNASATFNGTGLVDHARMSVYFEPEDSTETDVKVEVAATNLFYFEREVMGGLINVIKIGESSNA